MLTSSTKQVLTLLTLFSVKHIVSAEWDDLIMSPMDGKDGSTVVIIFGQGASIPTEEYEALGSAIQNEASYPIWFAVPQCPDNVASIPGGLKNGL